MKLYSTTSWLLKSSWAWLFTFSLVVTREINLTKLAGLSTINNYIDSLISPAFLVLLSYIVLVQHKLLLSRSVQLLLICSIIIAPPTSSAEWYSWIVRSTVLLAWLSVKRETWNKIWVAILPIALFDHALLSSVYPVVIVLWLQLLNTQKLTRLILPVAVLHSVVAVIQTITGHSAGLYWIGEKYLDLQTKGVAKTVLGDFVFLRGYGLFAHPIILGFFGLMIGILGTTKRQVWGVCLALLSQSRAVYIGFIGVFKPPRRFLFLLILGIALLFVIRLSGSDFYRYADFVNFAILILENPFVLLYGVGVGQYSHFLYLHYSMAPFQYQPVHSTLLLLISELGVPLTLLYFKAIKDQLHK
jgi:hypothetical protein